MQGNVFNIQRYSIHDGPGIRTTVFLKGCTLKCFWCHNPESIDPQPQLQFFPQKCVGCGKCFGVCPEQAIRLNGNQRVYEGSRCKRCGRCANACWADALVLRGNGMTTEAVLAEVDKDRHYYESSGGGVTFSGGEPLLQANFLRELLVQSKSRSYHTAVDTAGNVKWEAIESVLPYVDLWLYDIKVYETRKHEAATGSSNAFIQSNLKRLATGENRIIIRIPVIPGVNDDLAEMEAIAEFLAGLRGVELVELLPLNHMAEGKYDSLHLEYKAAGYIPPSRETLEALSEVLIRKNLPVRFNADTITSSAAT